MNTCIVCSSVNVISLTKNVSTLNKGQQLNVPLAYSVCVKCGRRFISKEQILINDKVIQDITKGI